MDPSSLSSNWKKLQATLNSTKTKDPASETAKQGSRLKRKRDAGRGLPHLPSSQQTPRKKLRTRGKMMSTDAAGSSSSIRDVEDAKDEGRPRFAKASEKINAGLDPTVDVGKYIALDCEMVGIGPNPANKSALARVSIVNYNGDQVYDSYVLPKEPVTDYRTEFSGITPEHMRIARGLEEVQSDVGKILKDRIIIGHSVKNDLRALMLPHARHDLRDTAYHPPHRKQCGGGIPRLKLLASELLGLEIQEGSHSSVEDAQACMLLFRRDKTAFEKEHAKRHPPQIARATTAAGDGPEGVEETNSKPKKKKKKTKKKK